MGPEWGNSPFCDSVILTERSVFMGTLLQDVRYGLPHAVQETHIHDRNTRKRLQSNGYRPGPRSRPGNVPRAVYPGGGNLRRGRSLSWSFTPSSRLHLRLSAQP